MSLGEPALVLGILTARLPGDVSGRQPRSRNCMIVLVDTSVWIRFLSNRAPYAGELDGLLSRDEVSGHDFVFGELLIGDKGGRKQLLADYERMHQAPVVPHADVVEFVRDRRLHGARCWLDRCAPPRLRSCWTP